MIELHCHTKISDNSMNIVDIMELAREKGITHLALTDHDTMEGLEPAKKIGEKYEITIIPGIEMSAYDFKRNTRAHILGYYIDPYHEPLKRICDPMAARRHEASYKMVEKIMNLGYNIDWPLVQSYAQGGTGVYKQHIMHALWDKGYTNGIYTDLYKQLFSSVKNKPGEAYVPVEYIDVREAIQTIKQAGGIPVLAHPGQFNNFDAVQEWVALGLKGIEVWHPLHDAHVEQLAHYYASTYNLIETGGSDFHGLYGEHHDELGSKNPGLNAMIALKEKAVSQAALSSLP
ncbi:PHP domain-containing protein [Salibacterium aidingense]|uniref:PHP domain-containing protein n=1 Tax=Salibacterium aidingense TaxID=384933 RepID=UPI003BC0048F